MSTEPSQPADADADADASGHGGRVVEVAEDGDIVLDVTFETSPETLKRSRRALLAANGRAARHVSPPLLTVRVAYRVSLEALTRHSRYFANLLSNPRFREARLVADAHSGLAARQVRPALAAVRDLPFVAIADDDEATQAAGREHVLEDMLRIMHQKPIKAGPRGVDMAYATTLAIMGDRFDCVAVISRALNGHKFQWPATSGRPMVDDLGRATGVERALRQKVLVAWLLCQPLRLHQATRELIVRGSSLWSALHDAAETETAGAWWNLPEGLEHELRRRRGCILNTIASVQRHFIGLYASRDRQCKLGYDSSAACDSFQLGQMVKFLTSKGLLFLVDFSPASLSLPDTSRVDIEELIATLKQYPSYQVDKHHTNCGPQIRVRPIMDYIRTMLSANVVAIAHADWRKRRADISWARPESGGDEGGGGTFAFTRAIANDERLRYEGVLHADRMAKALFYSTVVGLEPRGMMQLPLPAGAYMNRSACTHYQRLFCKGRAWREGRS